MIFNLFGKKKESLPEILYFNDTEGAFAYSCKYSHADITAGNPRVALIEQDFERNEKGFQDALLRVAGNNDYFNVYSQTGAPFVPPLIIGDLVLWLPMEPLPGAELGVSDKRTTWIGPIVGVLAPELIVKTQNYRMKIDYRDYLPSQK
jgi:hypothetical protein